MKLSLDIETCAAILQANYSGKSDELISNVVYDTRKIHSPNGALFFALDGPTRNGEEFIVDALSKGIEFFVVQKNSVVQFPAHAVVFRVNNTLKALQLLAKNHRQQFTYPVIAVTGSVGKTTFKEWAFHLLSPHFSIVRSPKSFNSQIGVALSLLEMHSGADMAIIEAGISKPNEMEVLRDMIQPDFGVFTALGMAHRENFESAEELLLEKCLLFNEVKHVWVSEQLSIKNGFSNLPTTWCSPIVNPHFSEGFHALLGILKNVCLHFGVSEKEVTQRMDSLPQLALRMETFEGINNNSIINDTYNLDADALLEALHFQKNHAGKKKRVVIIGLSDHSLAQKNTITKLIGNFQPDQLLFVEPHESIPWETISNSCVLIKASRERAFEHEVARGKAIKHRTIVEVNLSAIRHNLNFFKERIGTDVAILGMVKASSYGSGAERIALFLEQEGVAYLGVAFADEGVELRKAGVKLPILVMNPDVEHASTIVDFDLQPAIYSFEQLNDFITHLIHIGVNNYPVHLKFDTGMHRLGFQPKDKQQVLSVISSQPEIRVEGIYSHLADADNPTHAAFTEGQLHQFENIVLFFRSNLSHSFVAHILNSEGSLRYLSQSFDLIRLGIALYGYTENKSLKMNLLPSLRWLSAISQIQQVAKNEFIGYGCSFQAPKDMQIAVIPVGYADGFRRSLSNGIGSVSIKNQLCPIVGRVCMDMIMVDITGFDIQINDEVEIIGEHQTMEKFAQMMNTIPYEVMTGLSKRMERIYVEQ